MTEFAALGAVGVKVSIDREVVLEDASSRRIRFWDREKDKLSIRI